MVDYEVCLDFLKQSFHHRSPPLFFLCRPFGGGSPSGRFIRLFRVIRCSEKSRQTFIAVGAQIYPAVFTEENHRNYGEESAAEIKRHRPRSNNHVFAISTAGQNTVSVSVKVGVTEQHGFYTGNSLLEYFKRKMLRNVQRRIHDIGHIQSVQIKNIKRGIGGKAGHAGSLLKRNFTADNKAVTALFKVVLNVAHAFYAFILRSWMPSDRMTLPSTRSVAT
nr:MAG TPA: hypothetical protein [Caudoviricetes sp.]